MNDRLIHLDMMRGFAAVAVAIGHIRSFLFIDRDQVHLPTLAEVAFYAVTGLGHASVIAFFALSGFLVGGKALDELQRGTWSVVRFFLARLSRMWVVLIPALLLTLLCDAIGKGMGASAGYDGIYYAKLLSGPSINMPADNSISAFIGNIFFLQTIKVQVYGSNGPLWSLAYEFWYYAVFPLAASTFLIPRHGVQRACLGFVASVLAWWLPLHIMALGLVWVGGAIASGVSRGWRIWNPVEAVGMCLVAALMCVLGLVLVRVLGSGLASELFLGLSFVVLTLVLAKCPVIKGPYARVATALSEISFSLYATHFPILALLWYVWLAPSQFVLSAQSLALGSGLLGGVLGVAWVFWWLFERNTYVVRTWLYSGGVRIVGGVWRSPKA